MAKLAKDSNTVKLKEPVGLLQSVCLERQQTLHRLSFVKTEEILDRNTKDKERITGIPYLFAHSPQHNELLFYPASDEAYDVEVYYYPPMQKQ